MIRRLVKEDGAEWRRIRLEALRTCPTAFATSYEDAAEQDLAAFTAHIPPPERQSAIFGAFENETLCGTAGFRVPGVSKQRHKGELWGVYVAFTQRRQGLGAQLVRAVIAHARGRVMVLQLAVSADNIAARKLYEALGFETYGIERCALCVDGIYYDDALMAIGLTSA